jgi:hypothetical protein
VIGVDSELNANAGAEVGSTGASVNETVGCLAGAGVLVLALELSSLLISKSNNPIVYNFCCLLRGKDTTLFYICKLFYNFF